MKKHSLKNAAWYPYTVALCVAVVLFVILIRFGEVWSGLNRFFGFFKPVILGCVLAYIINPMSNFFYRTIFLKIKSDKRRHLFSNLFAFLLVILFFMFFLVILIPQLVESIKMFSANFDSYILSLNGFLESLGISTSALHLDSLISSSEALVGFVTDYISENIDSILATSAHAGKGIFSWLIAFVLSIYLLAEKSSLKSGIIRLLKALLGNEKYSNVRVFLRNCNEICSRYIVYNLIDSLIIGCTNAVFMIFTGMQYAGLVSFVVGLTNLIPTFGPVIGAVIGAFVLVLTKPYQALVFLAFTLILQACDGYVIKPRLFGNSLGVSGLWILIGIIVGGNMFGVTGILLAIPGIAILELIYENYLLPRLEKRQEDTFVRLTEQENEADA